MFPFPADSCWDSFTLFRKPNTSPEEEGLVTAALADLCADLLFGFLPDAPAEEGREKI
jgi:hypothetical protein